MTEASPNMSADPIRVMVVDDSAVVRGLLTRILESTPDISVVSSVTNGQVALNTLERNKDIDVIILDIEMPVMDGLTALPKLLKIDPDIKIIMASTLTERNAEISIRALQAGATDYIPKPSSPREISGGGDFRRTILEKVQAIGATRRKRRGRVPLTRALPRSVPLLKPAQKNAIVLRQPSREKPDILAIGSSTGGPQALFNFLKGVKRSSLNIPVVITQHMPATFTAILAEHIARMTDWPCQEAKDGDPLVAGQILLAPGDFHMIVESRGAGKVVRLNQNPPENFCRPAVDPLFRSVSKAFGGRVLAVVLTGMGADGQKGAEVVVSNGGTVIAQDEKSSVVWGMPAAVANAGLCSVVLPLDGLSSYVMRIAGRVA